jgi:hypothetical protein
MESIEKHTKHENKTCRTKKFKFENKTCERLVFKNEIIICKGERVKSLVPVHLQKSNGMVEIRIDFIEKKYNERFR